MPARSASSRISALVSDVDGTLVTGDKVLTPRAQAAVAALHRAGIIFAIVSSRPPRGLQMLIEPLQITTPVTGFNGGVLAAPDLSVIREHVLSAETARRAIALLDDNGVQPWVFAGQDWLARGTAGHYGPREEHTVGFPATVVADFDPFLDRAVKIVGVSEDFARLSACERDIRTQIGDAATVVRSQAYYLDITHSLANKGAALVELSILLATPLAEIAVIGDGENDVSMFARSGLSIAMGNASAEVKRAADFVTDSNQADGFAVAVERQILPRATPAAGTSGPATAGR